MRKDERITTIEQAKEYSIIKWRSIIDDLGEVLNAGEKSCGFCLHTDQERNGCYGCAVSDKCDQLDVEFFGYLQHGLDYITNDLIPFIENFEEVEPF